MLHLLESLNSPRAQLFWGLVMLAVVLAAGAAVINLTGKWRKRASQDRLSANDQLAQFRELYERGELSAEEFGRIRALLGERIRRELDVLKPDQGGPKPSDPPSAN
jgi:hypothetical protein